METIGQRLRYFFDQKSLKIKDVASYLDYSSPAVSAWLSDRNKPSLSDLEKLTIRYSLNVNWLITGEGSPLLDHSKEIQSNNNTILGTHGLDLQVTNAKGWEITVKGEVIDVPVVGEIAAGHPNNFNEENPIGILQVCLPNHHNYICFQVRGDSMSPEIGNGDYVIINKFTDWEEATNKIGAVLIDSEATLKRVNFDNTGRFIVLLPINDNFKPIIVDPHVNDVRLLGILSYVIHPKNQEATG